MSDTSTVELAARGSIISIMSLCANVKQQTSFIDLGAKRKTSSQSDTKCSFLQPGGKNVGPGVILLRVHSQGSSNYVSVCISQRQHKNNNSFHSQSGSQHGGQGLLFMVHSGMYRSADLINVFSALKSCRTLLCIANERQRLNSILMPAVCSVLHFKFIPCLVFSCIS